MTDRIAGGQALETGVHARITPALYAEAAALPGFGLFHDAPWHSVLADSFGWRVGAVAAREEDRLVGFLPFVRKRRFLRRIAVALPLTHRLPPLWAGRAPDGAAALVRALGTAEIHAPAPLPDWRAGSAFVETMLPIDRDEADLLAGMSKGTRYNIRTGPNRGVSVAAGAAPDSIATYAALQSETRHRQGSPDYPAAFFPAIARHLGGEGVAQVHLAELEGRPAAGALCLHDHRNRCSYYAYAASVSDPAVLRVGVNQIALWDAIRAARRRGSTLFSLGTSALGHESLRSYKRSFGGIEWPLDWTVIEDGGPGRGGIAHDGPLARIGAPVLRAAPFPLFRRLSPLLMAEVL